MPKGGRNENELPNTAHLGTTFRSKFMLRSKETREQKSLKKKRTKRPFASKTFLVTDVETLVKGHLGR